MNDRARARLGPDRGYRQHARNEAALAKLRFRAGDRLVVTSGPQAGKSGIVDRVTRLSNKAC